MLKKIIFIIIISFSFYSGYSQVLLHNPISGIPYRLTENPNVQGSPLVFADWKIGKIITSNGKTFNNVMLKYDGYKNKFYYNRNDSLFEILENILEVRLKDENNLNDSTHDMVFKKNIRIPNKISEGTFVQVLTSGKITLIKHYQKKIEDEVISGSSYGSTLTFKKFADKLSIYALVMDKAIPGKYTPQTIEELTPDKRKLINTFIKSKSLNARNEMDFAVILAYYNLISVAQ